MSQRAFLLCFFVVSALSSAQEVKFIDLSTVQPRVELRHPPPKLESNKASSGVGGGIGSASVSDGAPDTRDPHALGVAIGNLSSTNITLDPFDAEFRVVNTGRATIDIPISAHLSDLQPLDETKPFRYLSLAVTFDLDGTGSQQALGEGWFQLYGSADHDGTILSLKPGEWVRIKARVQLHTWPSEGCAARLKGDFSLQNVLYKPSTGGGFTAINNLYPNKTWFAAVPIRFTPLRSAN